MMLLPGRIYAEAHSALLQIKGFAGTNFDSHFPCSLVGFLYLALICQIRGG